MTTVLKEYDMIVFTDPGEEVDDETAMWWLNRYHPNMKVAYVCVNGKLTSQQRVWRVKSLIPSLNDVYTLEEFDFKRCSYEKNMCILQIGPVEIQYLDIIKKIVEKAAPYNYVLQGKMGATVNSNGAGQECAEYLYKHAIYQEIVDAPYPKYTYKNSLYFDVDLHEEIMRIGFKNTVGRAPALPFTVHLVGRNGANYETAKSIYEGVTKKKFHDIVVTNEKMSIAKMYIEKVNYKHPFVINKMKELNQVPYDHLIGLTMMLESFDELFGLNELIYSDDERFNSLYENNNRLRKQYKRFKKHMKHNKYIELTPAYDLKAAYVAVYGNCKNISMEEIMPEDMTNIEFKKIMKSIIIYWVINIVIRVFYHYYMK